MLDKVYRDTISYPWSFEIDSLVCYIVLELSVLLPYSHYCWNSKNMTQCIAVLQFLFSYILFNFIC